MIGYPAEQVLAPTPIQSPGTHPRPITKYTMNTTTKPMQLSEIQQNVLDRAIKMLEALKVDFAIRLQDGTVLGLLPIATEKTITRPKLNDWRARFPGYIESIKAMQLGDVLTWEAETSEEASAFRACVSSSMTHIFGHKSGITMVKDRSIDVMRVL